jgi:hypothetical protein
MSTSNTRNTSTRKSSKKTTTPNRMYIAIGLDAEREAMLGYPTACPFLRTSPYLQTAFLVFARSLREATGKARKLLGNSPKIVRQIGAFATHNLGEQPQPDMSMLSDAALSEVADLSVNDYESVTRDGVLVALDGVTQ